MEIKDDLQAFNPRQRDYRFKLWIRVVTPDAAYHHIFWRRVVVASLVFLLGSWLALAGGAWAFLRYHREYHDASYVDLALYPWRSEQFRTGLARHYLALGHEAVEKQNYREGYALLMAGLRRVPEDLGARKKVAVMQVRYGFLHRALDTLVDGLPYNPDLDYLKMVFGWLLEAKEDERVIATVKKILPAKPDADLKHLFAALQIATAHFERGRYDETERVVNEWGLTNSLEGQLLLAKCEAERGFPERAVQRLEREIARFSKRDELYLELVRVHRVQGNHAEARRYSLLRQFNDPRSPGPRIDVLHAYHEIDDRAAEVREIETFFTDFATNARALDMLSWFAAVTHQPTLLQRVRILAQSQQFPVDTIILAQVQEALDREAYREALDVIDGAQIDKKTYQGQLVEGMRAIALFGIADLQGGHRAIVGFTENARLRASDALLFARQLRLLGVAQEARALLDRACTLDPFNEPALAELVRLDTEASERSALAEHLPKLLKMRKPPRAVLEEILLQFQQPDDTELGKQVREALARSAPNPV
jgi:tetratricopeptide (TPR) repeat protein